MGFYSGCIPIKKILHHMLQQHHHLAVAFFARRCRTGCFIQPYSVASQGRMLFHLLNETLSALLLAGHRATFVELVVCYISYIFSLGSLFSMFQFCMKLTLDMAETLVKENLWMTE